MSLTGVSDDGYSLPIALDNDGKVKVDGGGGTERATTETPTKISGVGLFGDNGGTFNTLKVDTNGHLLTTGGGSSATAQDITARTNISSTASSTNIKCNSLGELSTENAGNIIMIGGGPKGVSDANTQVQGTHLVGCASITASQQNYNPVIVDATGALKVSGGGEGGGDATATNQTTMINSLANITKGNAPTSAGAELQQVLMYGKKPDNTLQPLETSGDRLLVDVLELSASGPITTSTALSSVQVCGYDTASSQFKVLKVDGNGVLETSGGGGGGGDASASNQTTMITNLTTINTSIGSTNTALTSSNTNTGTIAINQTNGNQSTKVMGLSGSTQVQLKCDATGVLETSGGGGGGGDATATNQTTIIGNQTNGTQATKIFGLNGSTQVQLKCDNTGILETTGGGTTGDIHVEVGGASTALTGTTIGSDTCLDVNIIAGGATSTSANQAFIIGNQTNGTQQTKIFGNNGGSQVQVKCDANGVISVSGGGEGGGDATATNQTTIIGNQTNGTQATKIFGNDNGTQVQIKCDSSGQLAPLSDIFDALVDKSQTTNLTAKHASTGTDNQITCSQNGGGFTKQFLDVGIGARFQHTAESAMGSTDNGYYGLKMDSLKNLLTNPQGTYNSSSLSLSNGEQASLQMDTLGNLMVSSLNTANISGTLQAISGTAVGSSQALDVNVVQTTGGSGGATGETTTQNITISGTFPLEIAGNGGATTALDLGAGANVSEFQFTITADLTNSASIDQKLLLQKIVPVSYHDGHGASELFNFPCDYSVVWNTGFIAGVQSIIATFSIKRPLRYVRLVNNNYKNPNRTSPTTYYDFRISFIKASKVVMT